MAALVLRVLCLGLLAGGRGEERVSRREVALPKLLCGLLLLYRLIGAGAGLSRHGDSPNRDSSSPLSTSDRTRGSSRLGTSLA